uniref:ATP-dependent zinc metalloprotease FtsH n=1 Tax=Schizocladia ischiensis TaxID=196139 RepID=A0A7S6U9Z9_9STRA|nr:ftsH [Schizocladia ischiensis]QOW07568.1 ftsH [Schizocladia ischiensis]
MNIPVVFYILLISLIGYLKRDNIAELGINLADWRDRQIKESIEYDKFKEYLEKDRIKRVDFYENEQIAIVDIANPEFGTNSLKSRVELPLGPSPSDLIVKLRKLKTDFTVHPSFSYETLWSVIGAFVFPLLILGLMSLILNFSNSNEWGDNDFFSGFGGPGQLMNFRKARVKIQLDANTGVLFKDVAGIDEAKQEFEEVVTFLQQPQLFTAVGANPPKGVILVGPPGTGKTLLAKAIAGEAGVPFISISGSEFVEMFVGIGASRVRDLFKIAQQNSPCILFIDEIDAVGRKRGTGVGGTNDEREQTLNQILTEMDGFNQNTGIIVIAATNRADILDSALLRPGRFDRQVSLNLPDLRGRTEILKVHSKNKKFSSDRVLKIIARRTTGFAGADLANLLNEAAILTARANSEAITIQHINTAIERIIAGLEGTLLGDGKSKRIVSFHEIGHGLVGTLLKSHNIVEKVTLVPRGQAQGLTWFSPSKQSLLTRGQFTARIIGTLAGRAAENVTVGKREFTSGASNDITQVTSVARVMVTRFGMSSLGPFALLPPSDNGPIFIRGKLNIKSAPEYSIETTTKISNDIYNILVEGLSSAGEIIQINRVILDHLSEILMQEESIAGNEFKNYISVYTRLPHIRQKRLFRKSSRKKTTVKVIEYVNKKDTIKKKEEILV